MQKAGTVYSNSHSYRKENFSSSIAIDRLSIKEEDQVLDHYSQLVPENFRGYYVNKLRGMGKHEFINRAERALRYGKNPQRLFASLMR